MKTVTIDVRLTYEADEVNEDLNVDDMKARLLEKVRYGRSVKGILMMTDINAIGWACELRKAEVLDAKESNS